MNFNLNQKNMLKKILQKNLTQQIVGWLISVYIKFCYHSSLWYVKGDDKIHQYLRKKKILVLFWHNRLLMAPFCWKFNNEFKMLISSHRDGKLMSNAVSHLGIKTIFGSSNKGKISSTKEILTELNDFNVVGITPDGPKGPKEKIKEGAITIQKKTKAVIFPLSCSARFKLKLNSWDNFLFVFPFNKIVAVWGNPIEFNVKRSMSENLLTVEKELMRISKLSENLSK